jgi:hypothetical protein
VLSAKSGELDQARGNTSDLQTEINDLRELLEATKRYADAAGRIAEKRMQVNIKQHDLSVSNADIGGRDLKTVEVELAERMEKKDQYANQASNEEGSLSRRVQSGTNGTPCLCILDQSIKQGNVEFEQSNQSSINSGTPLSFFRDECE